MVTGNLREVLEKIERDSGLPATELMRRADMSYDAWLSWKGGTRTPHPESIRKVQAALAELGRRQTQFARDLEPFASET